MRQCVGLLEHTAKVAESLDEDTPDVRWEVEPADPDTDKCRQRLVGARSHSPKIRQMVKRGSRLQAPAGA